MQHFKRAGVRLEADRDFKSSRDHSIGKHKFNSAIKLRVYGDYNPVRLTQRAIGAELLRPKIATSLHR